MSVTTERPARPVPEQTDAIVSSPPTLTEVIHPYDDTAPFDIEQAAFSVGFLDIHSKRLPQQPEALTVGLVDRIYDLAGEKAKSDHRLREMRQLTGLKSLAKIAGLPEEEYEKWIKSQPEAQREALRAITKIGRELLSGEATEGEETTPLGEMINLAETKLENAKRIVEASRR